MYITNPALIAVCGVTLGILLAQCEMDHNPENKQKVEINVTYFKDKYGICYEHTASEKHIAVGTVDYVTTVDCNGTGL